MEYEKLDSRVSSFWMLMGRQEGHMRAYICRNRCFHLLFEI